MTNKTVDDLKGISVSFSLNGFRVVCPGKRDEDLFTSESLNFVCNELEFSTGYLIISI
jgi:hypothetical protein